MNLESLVQETIAEYHRQPATPPTGQAVQLSTAQLAQTIDHTLLKPDAVAAHVQQLCREAIDHGFISVCVHPTWATLCLALLAETSVKVCSVIGFPQGATLSAVKAFETEQLVAQGVQEVDMVLNVGRLKNGDYQLVHDDIALVADAAHAQGALLKVIIETALLSEDEKIAASILTKVAGADFVKTSTGFNGGGATIADIALMRRVVGAEMGVKASGGVRTAQDALAMIAAGATRIGTSGGIRIIQEMAGAQVASANKETY